MNQMSLVVNSMVDKYLSLDYLHLSDIVCAATLGFRSSESSFLFFVRKFLANHVQSLCVKNPQYIKEAQLYYVSELQEIIKKGSILYSMVLGAQGLNLAVNPGDPKQQQRYKLHTCFLLADFRKFCEYLPSDRQTIVVPNLYASAIVARAFIAMIVWVMNVDKVSLSIIRAYHDGQALEVYNFTCILGIQLIDVNRFLVPSIKVTLDEAEQVYIDFLISYRRTP